MPDLYPEDIENIKNVLSKYDACDFSTSNKKIVPQDIAVQTLRKILQSDVTDGPSMRAIQCLFQIILLSEKDVAVEGYGIYRLKKGINDWLGKIKEIGTGEGGMVYKTSIINENVDVVIKYVNKKMYNQERVLLEYLIGLVLNDLRYLVPNFAYTLGAFSCSYPDVKPEGKIIEKICDKNTDFTDFILYEKIDGITLFNAIYYGKITVLDWVPIFGMILLALEVAQRECRFTHYDLHVSNIMLVQNVPDYEVVLDGTVYKIIKPKYVPIILDFGTSSVYTNGKYLGRTLEPNKNKHIIPVRDMYYFIYNSFSIFSNPISIRSQDKNLNILVELFGGHRQGKHLIERLNIHVGKQQHVSGLEGFDRREKLNFFLGNIPGASETPLQLFKRLYQNYTDLFSGKIVPVKRDKLYSLKYTSSVKSYYDILGDPNEGLKQTILNVKKCTRTSTSFILSRYQVYVLENYNKKLGLKTLEKLISDIKKKLSIGTNTSIEKDLSMLNQVFAIELPDPDWKDRINTVTSVMPYSFNNSAKKSSIKYMAPLIDYISSVKPYFDMYYTILELGLEKEQDGTYGEWVKKFTESENFRFYTENIDFITEGTRWCQTLDGSLEVNIDKIDFRKRHVKSGKPTDYDKFWDFLFEKSDGSEILIKDEALVNQ